MSCPKLNHEPMRAKDPNLKWVETVDGGAKIRFTVYSPSIWGVWTHYSGRTKPCFENHDFCVGGHDEATLRWYGFLYGFHFALNRTCFLQITEAAGRQFLDQVAPGVSLRGMVIDVERTASKQGRLNLQVATYMKRDCEKVGKDLDPQLSLFKMWKVNHVGHAMNLSLVTAPADIPDDSGNA